MVNGRWRGLGLAMVAALCAAVVLGLVRAPASAAASVPAPTIGTTQQLASVSSLNAVACETSTTCVAVGSGTDSDGDLDGVVVPIVNGVAGTPVAVPGGGATELSLTAVSCPTSSTCYAAGDELAPTATTDSGAEVVTISGGTPATAQAASSAGGAFALFNDIACTSATSCVAVGSETSSDGTTQDGVSSLISSGTPGVLQTDSATQSLNGVFCAGTICGAGGSQLSTSDSITSEGVYQPLSSGGAAGSAQTLSATAELGFGACPVAATTSSSPTTGCLVLGDTGPDAADEVVLPVGSSGAGNATAAPDLLGITCASASLCVGVGATDQEAGTVTDIANGAPGPAVSDSDTNVNELLGVACATATSCVAVGIGADESEGVVVPLTVPAVASGPGGSGSGSGSGPGSPSTGASGELRVAGVKLDGPKLTLHLACGRTARCSGDVTETIAHLRVKDGQWAAVPVRIGNTSFDLSEGKDATKTVTLNPAGRRALVAAGKRMTSLAQVTLGHGADATEAWHRSVTLHPDKPATSVRTNPTAPLRDRSDSD